MASFNLHYLLKALSPNAVPLGVRASAYEFHGWSPHEWHCYPCKTGSRELPCPMCHVRIHRKSVTLIRPSPNHAGTLISDFQLPEL